MFISDKEEMRKSLFRGKYKCIKVTKPGISNSLEKAFKGTFVNRALLSGHEHCTWRVT